MSNSYICSTRQYLVVFQSFWLALFLIIILCSPAIGDEKKSKAELEERKAFIEKAMDENRERLRERFADQSKLSVKLEVATTLKPFGDWDFYYVEGGAIRWSPNKGQKFQPVNVPKGFVTDLTSIPRMFWQVHRPEGRYAFAAVVHDYLYWEQTRSRKEADQILKIAMEDSKVDSKLIDKIYLAVRTFGRKAWENNKRLKKSGEHRILKRFPEDFTISWSDWKKRPEVFAEKQASSPRPDLTKGVR